MNNPVMTARPFLAARAPLACTLALLTPLALAQAAPPEGPASMAWQRCTALGEAAARLACFDAWAGQQAGPAPGTAAAPSAASLPPPSPVDTTLPATRLIEVARVDGCRDPQYSELARFWELESGSSCGVLRFRGYRPMTAAVVASDGVNRQPGSTAPGHTAAEPVAYRGTEARIQLSVRTKIAQGLLTQGHPTRKDSLWFGYTQQSYWQLFSPQISRPFRTTDHEPEVVYVYPTELPLPGGGRWRYAGIGVVHQSNGQSLPLSRSWNRAYLMAGLEWGQHVSVQARLWKRIPENAASDDNPGISDYLGRGELAAYWNVNPDHRLGVTLRHALARPARGSVRLEWSQSLASGLGGGTSNLRLQTQLFSGYGDSLVDYNRRRTVLTVGLSLVDF